MQADQSGRSVDLGDFTREVESSTGVPAEQITSRGTQQEDELILSAKEHPSVESAPDFELLQKKLIGDVHSQLDVLRRSGIIVSDAEYEGYNSLLLPGDNWAHCYPPPSDERLENLLEQYRDVVIDKSRQGFDRMIAVPALCPIGMLARAYIDRLEAVSDKGELIDCDGKHVALQRMSDLRGVFANLFSDYDAQSKYYPERFDEWDGLDLYELRVQPQLPGWELFMVQDPVTASDFPEVRYGMGDRTPLPIGWPATRCTEQLSRGGVYKHEVGYTPRLYFSHALQELDQRSIAFDTTTETLLFGASIRLASGHVNVARISTEQIEADSNIIRPMVITAEPFTTSVSACGRTAVRLI